MILLFLLAFTVGQSPEDYVGTWYSDQNPDLPLVIAEDGTYTSDELTDGTWEGPENYSIRLRGKEQDYTMEHAKTSFSNDDWSFSGDALRCSKIDTWYFRIKETAEQSYDLRHPTKAVAAAKWIRGFWTTRENARETFHFREDSSFILIYNDEQGNPETVGGIYNILEGESLNIERTEWNLNLQLMPDTEAPLSERAMALTESGNWHISKQDDTLTLTKMGGVLGDEVTFYQSIAKN